ncbi:hypothetical protein AB8898_12235 [Yersinia enterocolitica]|uniref:hypothetical protein n=1 Tax=Yersinia enterocolitica TaxID=630 RepID=UPI003D04FF5E
MSEIKQYDTEVRLEAVMGTNHYGVHIHAMTTEDLHSKSGIAVELAWRDLRIEQLIAQLEAAHKRIAELDNSESQLINERDHAESTINSMFVAVMSEKPEWSNMYQFIDAVDEVEDFVSILKQRAESAEAALSAANEKLKGEQVPVAVIVLSKNWPDTGRKVIDYYIEKIQHLPVGTELFTAPQKPVVLSSSTVMSRAYVVQAIKAAGSTVEGE